MRQKIIFIDIDGPLAWGTWNEGWVTINEDTRTEFGIPYPWVKEDCDALKTILDETNAKLVLIASVRFLGLGKTIGIPTEDGICKKSGPVVGPPTLAFAFG